MKIEVPPTNRPERVLSGLAVSPGIAVGTAWLSEAGALPDTDVVEAYEAFSRGLLNRSAETFESLDRAVWLFERAVSLDPTYARAHVELGAAYGTKADYLSMPELRGRALVNQKQFDLAVKLFDEVLAIDATGKDADRQKLAASLGKTSALAGADKTDEAIKSVEE